MLLGGSETSLPLFVQRVLRAYPVMRVGIFVARFHPAIGGAERQALLQAKKLLERGVAVEVITTKLPGTASKDTVHGIPVRRLPCFDGIEWMRGKGLFRFAQVLRTSALRKKYDVIHIHAASDFAAAAVLASKATGVPSVLKIASSGNWFDMRTLRKRFMVGPLMSHIVRRVDRVIALNSRMVEELLQCGFKAQQIVKIPNGVEASAPRNKSGMHELRKALNLPQDSPIVIYVGAFSSVKNLGCLVRAFYNLRTQGTSAHLLLVGDGPDRPAIEEYSHANGLADSITITGLVDDVMPYLRCSDVFVLPSQAEGLSNSLLEAMSVGLPCVATAVGGNTDLVQDRRTGLLVTPGDSQALGQTLAEVLTDTALSEEIATAGRTLIKDEYSIESTVDRLMRIYGDLVPVQDHDNGTDVG